MNEYTAILTGLAEHYAKRVTVLAVIMAAALAAVTIRQNTAMGIM